MAYSYIRYAGNGSTTNYVFSFPYISADHIKVRVNGTLVTSWSFLNSSTIQFVSAPISGAIIDIRRETPKESSIVNFTDGSVLLERDLDLLATYDLYLAQETKDGLDSSISQTYLGVFDGQNKRITNVADPVAAQDAVTKNWVETTYTPELEAIALASAASASASAASAGNASTSASNAAGSAVAAASSAASAAALLDNFDDRYLGAKAADPAVDNDGAALVIGAIYFNNVSGRMKVYTSLGWVDSTSAAVVSLVIYEFVATAGQTTFSGVDAEAKALGYTVGGVFVTLNGLTLRPGEDYTATTGTSIVLASAASVGDELQVHAYNNFSVADIQSSAVSYAAAGTGAVATTVQAKLRESVSVKDFGAVGDGTTDDTVAIQNAFNSLTYGGTVNFENSKTYMIDGSYLPIQTLFGGVKPTSGTIIEGNNATLKVITSSAIGYCVLNLNAINNIVVNNLNIQGDVGRHVGVTGEFGHGLMVMGCDNIVLNNLFITLCWGDAVLFSEYAHINGNTNVDVSNCEFVDCRRQGVSVIDLTNGTFTGCSFRNIGATAVISPASGVDLEPDYVGAQASNIDFIGCTFNNNQSHGFIAGSTVNVVENIRLIGCSFYNNGASAITANSVGTTPKMRNVFEVVGCDIKGQVLVDNCKIIGGQIILEEIYTNSRYAVESAADLPFQMIGVTVLVTGTRRAAAIYGATSENNRKLISSCKFNQDGNTLTNLDQWTAIGGFVTLDNCQMTRTGAAPATGYTFSGATDFDGFNGKMVNCYLDPKLAVGFAQDQLMNRAAQRGWFSAAPTTGAHTVGEIVFNSSPTNAAGQPAGWICVVAGTPGTWRAFGVTV